MEEILLKLIKGEKIKDRDLTIALYEMCDTVHAGCDESCLINAHVLTDKQIVNMSCPYFKDGKMMLQKLREVL